MAVFPTMTAFNDATARLLEAMGVPMADWLAPAGGLGGGDAGSWMLYETATILECQAIVGLTSKVEQAVAESLPTATQWCRKLNVERSGLNAQCLKPHAQPRSALASRLESELVLLFPVAQRGATIRACAPWPLEWSVESGMGYGIQQKRCERLVVKVARVYLGVVTRRGGESLKWQRMKYKHLCVFGMRQTRTRRRGRTGIGRWRVIKD